MNLWTAVTQEFHISITNIGDAKYLIRTERVEQGVPLAEVQLEWAVETWLEQARQLIRGPLLNLLQRSSDQANWPSPTDAYGSGVTADLLDPSVMSLGQHLYNALFQGLIRDSWVIAQGVAHNRHQLLRLRLGIKDPQLQQLPWEVMNSGDRSPIATGTDLTFCRYHPRFFSPLKPATVRPVHDNSVIQVLMVLASPDDQDRLALSREVQQLQASLRQPHSTTASGATVPQPLPIQVTLLEQPGRRELAQTLEQGQFHVLHYAGHSNLGETGGDLYLVSRQTGLSECLSGDDLAGLLVNNGIQLAVFNSCRSAYSSDTDIGGWREQNLAQALINRGVPGVIAMAERIPDEIAIAFTQLFYRNLKIGHPVDLSLNRTRQGLLSVKGSDQFYWALPVLYMQPGFDGYLGQSAPVPLMNNNGADNDGAPSPQISSPHPAGASSPAPRSADLPEGLDPTWDDIYDYWDDDDDVDLDAIADTVDASADQDYAQDSALVGNIMQQLATGAPPDVAAPNGKLPDTGPADAAADLVPCSASPPSHLPPGAASPSAKDGLAGDASPPAIALGQPGSPPAPSTQTAGKSTVPPSAFVEPSRPGTLTHQGRRSPLSRWLNRLRTQSPAQAGVGLVMGMVAVGALVGVGINQTRQPSGSIPGSSDLPISGETASGQGDARAAIIALNNQDLVTAASHLEYLLDTYNLKAAREVIDAVTPDQLANPKIRYLLGRLQWQQWQQQGADLGQTRDFNLEDVLRSWQYAVDEVPKRPGEVIDQIRYHTALGFAQYSNGQLQEAIATWQDVTKLQFKTDAYDQVQQFIVDAYAGLAIALYQSAQTAPPAEQAEYLRDAQKSYCLVFTLAPNRFGSANGLSGDENWLWGEIQIADWQALGPVLEDCQ